jgi:hypothetical protein
MGSYNHKAKNATMAPELVVNMDFLSLKAAKPAEADHTAIG